VGSIGSPDTLTILFGRAGAAAGVYHISPGGRDEQRLITDPFAFGVPSPNWSHDGTQIAYQILTGIGITDASGANAVTVPNTSFVADFDLK
jgi:Tol biopolymer transport system component